MKVYRIIAGKKHPYRLKTPLTEFIYKGYKFYQTPAVYDYENGNTQVGVTVYCEDGQGGYNDIERSTVHSSGAELFDFKMSSEIRTFDEVIKDFNNRGLIKITKTEQQFELRPLGLRFPTHKAAFEFAIVMNLGDFSIVPV